MPRAISRRSRSEDAAPFVPEKHTLPLLREAVNKCRGCELYKNAIQAVFGELVRPSSRGLSKAAIMIIGEQPGDREDTEGRPFVGPSGKLLDRCMQEANIDRRSVYVTNAVKHFNWEPRGKRRIHKKPGLKEIRACRPWLDAELDAVRPSLIICLGAVPAQSLLGTGFKITKSRGVLQKIEDLPPIIATVHPSSILRAITEEDRERDTALFINDLKQAAKSLAMLA
jgi:uracil-DNA glycosylase family protein